MRPRIGTPVALCLLPVVLLLAISLGVESVPFKDTLTVVVECLGGAVDDDVAPTHRAIVKVLRLPRVVLLAFSGAALAMAGAALQSTFRNPMASPGIIGVTAGASLGAVLVIAGGAARETYFAVTGGAFAGAIAASLLVYFLSFTGGRPSTTSLILTGVAVSALASAMTSWVQTTSPFFVLRELLFWTVGGARHRGWEHVVAAAPAIVVGGGIMAGMHRSLDALALGEEHALSVGVSLHRTRLLLIVTSAVVAGSAVSVCGPIPFVGLVIPHIGRLIVGSRGRTLLPFAAIVGAEFLVLCDLIGRMLSGEKVIHLGIVTAFLGVPFFLWLLWRAKVRA